MRMNLPIQNNIRTIPVHTNSSETKEIPVNERENRMSTFLEKWIQGNYTPNHNESVESRSHPNNTAFTNNNKKEVSNPEEVTKWPGICMAMTSNDVSLPKTWRQAIGIDPSEEVERPWGHSTLPLRRRRSTRRLHS